MQKISVNFKTKSGKKKFLKIMKKENSAMNKEKEKS